MVEVTDCLVEMSLRDEKEDLLVFSLLKSQVGLEFSTGCWGRCLEAVLISLAICFAFVGYHY